MTAASAIAARDPSIDCPACPKCGALCGTPCDVECGVTRWDGPREATLFCPACGNGWVASVSDFMQAARAWIAYEEKEVGRDTGDILAWLVRQKTIAPGLTNAEVAVVERLIADLEGR